MTTAGVGLVERKYLRRLVGAMDGAGTVAAVVLVGSWARGAQADATSDLDVLVVAEGRVPPPVGRIQLIRRSVDELRRLALAGDDFAQWALRFGRPLKGGRLWEALREDVLGAAPWPGGERNLDLARRRLAAAEELLAMGDVDASAEEARYGLSHLARAVLLEKGVFPLSRPELPGQLDEVGERELAAALRSALRPGPADEGEVRAAVTYLRSRLPRSGRSPGPGA